MASSQTEFKFSGAECWKDTIDLGNHSVSASGLNFLTRSTLLETEEHVRAELFPTFEDDENALQVYQQLMCEVRVDDGEATNEKCPNEGKRCVVKLRWN